LACFGNYGFYPIFKRPPLEQYPPTAGEAFDTDIRPQADNAPFISPAGMGFA